MLVHHIVHQHITAKEVVGLNISPRGHADCFLRNLCVVHRDLAL